MNIEEIERPEKVEKDTGDSLRDTLSKAFDVSENDTDTTEQETPSQQEASRNENDDTGSDAGNADASGADNDATGDEVGSSTEDAAANGSLDARAPVKWTKDEKETWEALKAIAGDNEDNLATVQKALGILGTRNKSMEAGLTKRFQELAAQQKQYETSAERYQRLDSILAPRREQWASSGTDEIAVIGELMRLNDHAVSNPKDFAKWFVNGRGLTAEDLGFTQSPQKIAVVIDENGNELGSWPIEENGPVGAQAAQQQQQSAPQPMQVSPEVQQRIDRLEAAERQRAAEQANTVNSAAATMVQEFAQATDDNGNLLYPLFEDVRATMSALVSTNPNLSLDDAYHAAIAANPELRQMVSESEEIRLRSELERQTREASQPARLAAASLPTGGTPGGVRRPLAQATETPGGDLRAALSAEWDDQLKRGRI